ncbi:Glycosyl transferase family 2 [Novosphingobium sp. CF614]|uniref:glycosyltransferase family 2 protein n=1 Tax=Novosphingobium sp. CF614 TaxID=1884364 RepID=UPI0008EEC390|nr:glycosyltransferase family A protein [Novosphingobium sp. CF614]SFG20447.1 Glycosyl transferase family 2 [Novosphingobium sp. CF614]
MTGSSATQDGPLRSATPAATVVIPTYNSSSTLLRALASIDDCAAEILVVDDASDDAEALQTIVALDPRVTLIGKLERSNAAHSRALGLARAAGDVVLFLDSDDYFLPGHVARRRALHATQQASVAIGRFRLSDGVREWDGPMAAYDDRDFEDYLFAGGGDARSSTISVYKPALRGTTFDARLAKHQDWGFLLAASRNGERIGFDPVPGATISLVGNTRMSARSNVDASLAFARDQLRSAANRRRFLLGRLRTSLRLGDVAAARRFRDALLELDPLPGERWGSTAMVLAAQLGLAIPLHRLLRARR